MRGPPIVPFASSLTALAGHALAGHALAVNVLDASSLLAAFGALGIAVVLFAETGLLVGFFLPGDSLLFTAGLLCVSGTHSGPHLVLWQVILAAVAGALIGAQVGYLIGARGGRALLARNKRKSLTNGVERAEELLSKYGYGKAIVLARFIPVVRTVLNPLAGVLEVPVRTFTLWQVVGGTVWAVGVVLAGYALGSSVPNIDNYLLPIIGLVVVVSVIPIALELLRARREARQSGSDQQDGGAAR
ncbi:membrane-associated protein [Kitasatospora sp. GAS204A]|uniref:DedA family protein n=1 Tax=unclassified Kitasatospora TaxID=2633591 RepID=UPI0024761CF7|nr:DedA family protein [Kitasatospora sp. GAS204B]MDH6117315.1 membrane-associated protein [Kitasatospora sp. GAS204B]